MLKELRWVAKLLGSALLCLLAPPLLASDLIGDVKGAYSSPKGAFANPANAGHIDKTMIEATPTIFQSKSLKARYPGSPTIEKDQSGLGTPLSFLPAFVYKLTPSFGIGITDLVPPGSINLSLKSVPIVVLDEANFVDINATATSKGGAGLVVGWQIFEGFSLGLKASYSSIVIDAEVVPRGGGNSLVNLTTTQETTNVTAGVRFDIAKNILSIGLASDVFTLSNSQTTVDSALAPEDEEAGNGIEDGASSGVGTPFSSVLLGVQLSPTPAFQLLTDIEYSRAATGQTTFSLVGLREKEKEVYDTVAVRAGLIAAFSPTSALLLGYRYEPSSIGPGGRGDDSLAGFGSIDLVTIYADQAQLTPYYVIASGARFRLGERKEVFKGKNGKKRVRRTKPWVVAAGLAYQKGALGIDETGELPAAYLQKGISIPLIIKYRF